jgi:hypothetical protein
MHTTIFTFWEQQWVVTAEYRPVPETWLAPVVISHDSLSRTGQNFRSVTGMGRHFLFSYQYVSMARHFLFSYQYVSMARHFLFS